MEKLATLQNDTQENGVRIFNEILDYNIKRMSTASIYTAVHRNRQLRGEARKPPVPCDAPKSEYRLWFTRSLTKRLRSSSTGGYARTFNKGNGIYQGQQARGGLYNQFHTRLCGKPLLRGYLLKSVCGEARLPRRIYPRILRKMNVNLSDYINSFRIKKAVALIEPSEQKQGYRVNGRASEYQYVHQIIQEIYRYTPGEYRKKHFNEM